MKFKKLCSVILSAAMVIAMLPTGVLAAENSSPLNGEEITVSEDSVESIDAEEADVAENSTNPEDYESKYLYVTQFAEDAETARYNDTSSNGIPINLGKSDYDSYFYTLEAANVGCDGQKISAPPIGFYYHPYTYKNKVLTQPPVEGDWDEMEYDVCVTDEIKAKNSGLKVETTWMDKDHKVLADAPSAVGVYYSKTKVTCDNFSAQGYSNIKSGKFVAELPEIKIEIKNYAKLTTGDNTSKTVYYQAKQFDTSLYDAIKVWRYDFEQKKDVIVKTYSTYGMWVTESDYLANKELLEDDAADFSDLTPYSSLNAGNPMHAGDYRYVFYATFSFNGEKYVTPKYTYKLTVKPLEVKKATLTVSGHTPDANGVYSVDPNTGNTTSNTLSLTLEYDPAVKNAVLAQTGTFDEVTGIPTADGFGSSVNGSNKIYAMATSQNSSDSLSVDFEIALNMTGTYDVTLCQDNYNDYQFKSANTLVFRVGEGTFANVPSISVHGALTSETLPTSYKSDCSFGYTYQGRGQTPFSPLIQTKDSDEAIATEVSLTKYIYIDNMPEATFYASHRLTNGDLYIPAGKYNFAVYVPAQTVSGVSYGFSSLKTKMAVVPKKVTLELNNPAEATEGEYTGENLYPYSVKIVGLTGNDTAKQAGTLVTSYTIGDDSIMQIRDIGIYTVTVHLQSNATGDYYADDFVKDFRVKGKVINVSINDVPAVSPWGKRITYTLSYTGYANGDGPIEAPRVQYDMNQLFVSGATINLKLQKGSGNPGKGYEFDYDSATATTTIGEGHGTSIEAGIKAKLKKTSYTYTGSSITPLPTVTYETVVDGKTSTVKLALNQDYTLAYENNKDVTTDTKKAKIIIQGIGAYSGIKEMEFTILPKSLSKVKISAVNDVVPGQEPMLTVMDGDIPLEKGIHYTLAYNGVSPLETTVAAKSKVYIVACEGSNYTGQSSTAKFNITPDLKDISTMGLTIELKNTAQKEMIYTGKALKPAIIVKKDGVVFKGCKVVYENNINVGTPTIRLMGVSKSGTCGNAYFTDKEFFRIKPADFSKVSAPSTLKVSASLLNSENPLGDISFSVKYKKQPLTQGVDYTCDTNLSTELQNHKAGDTITVYLKPLSSGVLGRNFEASSKKLIKIKLVATKLTNYLMFAQAANSFVCEFDDSDGFKITKLSAFGTELIENTDFKVTKVTPKVITSGGTSHTRYYVTINAVKGSPFTGKTTFFTESVTL